ncbi:permease [Fictibacillus terranigra]|uniref:Permease n=1 Tax=Fictibacillus terranigra TaxID=3058424 RepID=A0ABT8E8B7_9BACL|nr:permease [Fictibacillus sp. CENA-BCM004]MDN4074166.1 permease [Fictibacillus sp. CENA-BCM004]
MSQFNDSVQKEKISSKDAIWFIVIFMAIAAAGLLYVKWWPYFQKAISASATHSIGPSILGDQSASSSPWAASWDYAKVYFQSVWKAALLGILLGSLIQVLLPSRWLLKVLGKTSFGSTAAGGLASIPGMMCTCCAAPMAVGMRKKKVSIGASLAFWLGNPTINPATLIFMTFVLSWKFTVLRLFFGLILVFGVSYFANRFAKNAAPVDLEKVPEGETFQEEDGPFFSRWIKSLGMMLLHIGPAYIFSVLLLGAARVWLFPQLSEAATNSLFAVIGFALVGMLFVIPTAAEIPIIQTFMLVGLGAGPAAALLITLPALSLPSLLIVSRSYPKRVLLFVTISVVVLGVLCGITGMFVL